ncbi:MerR family transcriptional regulator [Ornithinimicrobium cerasi]|uniref:Transcriptional regulator, MerR family n=1 Tax=Ornithinimicrobium cerasi TaxID=2248773 RepID=A0A285VSP1_9MICO|nr:MerR family transcriptional regulator [Ornithinimicrobium cerasi]SOC57065.1 transcriptional regulator, MerR family [Ornithinimicrobium cerasi]
MTGGTALVHIGEVAERTGLSHRTIRYYEEMGLVEPAARTEGGFRLYDAAGIERLLLVMPMKPLGFTIEEIRDLLVALDVLTGPESTEDGRAAARAVVDRTRATAQERVAELKAATVRAEAFTSRLGQLRPDAAPLPVQARDGRAGTRT